MDKNLLRKKLEYATPEEVLFIFLNDISIKFKQVIEYWKNNDVKGTILASQISDGIMSLKYSLDTTIGNEQTQEGLKNIANIYDFILDEITMASFKKDFKRMEEVYSVFLQVKSIFDEDRIKMYNV